MIEPARKENAYINDFVTNRAAKLALGGPDFSSGKYYLFVPEHPTHRFLSGFNTKTHAARVALFLGRIPMDHTDKYYNNSKKYRFKKCK